tara:strand:- start:859 stop:1041 length:183 start_codon:yes stop_codon:yes gene_type:complete
VVIVGGVDTTDAVVWNLKKQSRKIQMDTPPNKQDEKRRTKNRANVLIVANLDTPGELVMI